MEAQVHNIFNLNTQKKFSEDEAYELLNLLIAVTNKAKNKINALRSQIEYNKNIPSQAMGFEKELNIELQKWSEKVRRLGGIPLSLYQVKIPADKDGFYLWEHPKSDLEFHF